MKRDPKVLIIAIPMMIVIYSLYSSLNKRAEEDFRRKTATEPEPAPIAAYHVPAGGSETLTGTADIKGTVSYSVDIDSSEGYIYLYDKNGRVKDRVHYTGNDMPVTRTADVKKGAYSLEVTRTPSSSGTGDMSADIDFTADRSAVTDRMTVGILITSAIATFLMLVAPKRIGRHGETDGDLVMKDGYVREEYKTPFDRIVDFLEIYKH